MCGNDNYLTNGLNMWKMTYRFGKWLKYVGNDKIFGKWLRYMGHGLSI